MQKVVGSSPIIRFASSGLRAALSQSDGDTSRGMPEQADFEVVRQTWGAMSKGGARACLPLIAEDVEIVPFGAALQSRSYAGHEGVLDWWDNEIVPNWQTFEVIPEEFERVDERLLVFGHWRACGRASGVSLEVPATWVIEVRDGKIARWQTFTDRQEAIESVGLDG